MAEWIVALLSSGATLVVALLTTWINSKNARKTLAMQLNSESRRSDKVIRSEMERVREDRIEAKRVLLFESRREASLHFITAFNEYSVASAGMLGFIAGARSMVSSGQSDKTPQEIQSKANREYRVREIENDAIGALAAVSLYFPEHVAASASSALQIESHWVRKMVKHYLEGADDPGPNTADSALALGKFTRLAQELLGVDSGSDSKVGSGEGL